jgi:hypothetical protein
MLEADWLPLGAGAAAHRLQLGERIVDKLPLVVVVLLLVDQKRMFRAGGSETDNARSAKGLAAKGQWCWSPTSFRSLLMLPLALVPPEESLEVPP